MIPSEIATAADYAQALMTVRRAKNVLALVIGIVLVGQIALFLLAHFHRGALPPAQGLAGSLLSVNSPDSFGPGVIGGPDVSASRVAPLWDWVHYLVGLSGFVGIAATLVWAVSLLMVLGILLVGRLIGVSWLIRSFFWCVVLIVMIFPWQAFLNNSTFTAPEFKIPGVLYTWNELMVTAAWNPADNWEMTWLHWGRFALYPLLAIAITLNVHRQSSRGLRMALGESFAPVPGGAHPADRA